jgi:putative transposase
MVGALVIAGVAWSVDRVAGVGIDTELVLDLEVLAQVVDVDITVNHQPFGDIFQPRHPQPKMTLGIGDRQLLARLLLAIFGDIFTRERIAVLAPEGDEQLERPAPPRALAVGAAFIGLRRRDIQDARKFTLVLVLHRAWIRLTDARTTKRRERKSPICMPRSCIELKNCSLCLSNPTTDLHRPERAGKCALAHLRDCLALGYRAGGPEALEDKPSKPDRVWNRIPDDVRERIVAMALEIPELSPRELATRFTDTEGYFVSESSVYRLLKAHDLITSPAFVVIKAADEFKDKTTAPNQLWQTDFTYLKVIGWGWFYLSTILDDFSRYIIAWQLCTTMRADDVTDTLQMALTASGCASARVAHKPRLLSDNGSSYVSGNLAKWLQEAGMHHVRGAPSHPLTQGKIERWHQTLKNRILLENYYLPGDLETHISRFVEHYNHSRYHESLHNLTPADVYFRARPNHPASTRKDQTRNHQKQTIAAPKESRLNRNRARASRHEKPQPLAKHMKTDSFAHG